MLIRQPWKTRTAALLTAGGSATILRAAWAPTSKRAMCASAAASSVSDSIAVSAKPAAHISDIDILLYQYKICPFCNKIKAFLDFYGLKYRTVEVNPLSKDEIKNQLDTTYRKVPICVINGETVCDSSVILQTLQDLLHDRGVLLPSHHTTPRLLAKEQEEQEETSSSTSSVERVWTEWVDKDLAVLLFPNITRNFPESWQAFAYINDVDTFSTTQKMLNRVLGPVAMWAAQGKIKKKYNIEDERAAMFKAVYKWADAVEASGDKFQGGRLPSLADVCVFGCLRSISGLDTHTEVVNDPRVKEWYNAMAIVVGPTTEE